MKMSKEEIFAIIDDELEKRKDNTFLLWDFPNDVKKRIEELYQSIDNAKPSEALDCGLKLYKMVESAGNSNGFNLNETWKYYKTIKQYILKAQEQKKVLNAIFSKNLFEPTHKYIVGYSKDYANYCKLFGVYKLDEVNKLTEEEFNTLKEYANEITRVKD